MPPSARQFVVGDGEVPQHVPRADIKAGIPGDVTFAPSVAPVVVIPVAVGEVTVGTTGVAAQLLPFHVVPEIQLPVTVVELSTALASLTCTVFEPFVIGYETPVPDAEVEYVFTVVEL